MTQVFRVELDGVDITDFVETTTITEKIQTMYNIAKLTISEYRHEIVGRNINIYYGDKTFSGFVHEVDDKSKLLISAICRSQGAKLDEPFSQRLKVTEDANTASELCSLYTSTYGVPISYQAHDFSFGGSYERDGTALHALIGLAEVTGAEYYDTGTGIVIAPKKSVTSGNLIIEDHDCFNYIGEDLNMESGNIGLVTIKNMDYTEDEVLNKITVDIDEETGFSSIYTSPKSVIPFTNIVGGTYKDTLSIVALRHEEVVVNKVSITTKGVVSSVVKVTLNGVTITNYSFNEDYNKIIFTEPLRGELVIDYISLSQDGSVSTSSTPLGEFFTLDISYLDQVVSTQGFIKNKTSLFYGSNMIVEVENNANAVSGFKVRTIGGEPNLKLYLNGSLLPQRFPVVPNSSYIKTETLSLVPYGDGYRGAVDLPANEFLLTTSYGNEITYGTMVEDGVSYFTFSDYVPKVEGTYKVIVSEHYVKIAETTGEAYLTVTDLTNDEVIGFDIAMPDYTDLDQIPCELNQTIYINISEETGFSSNDVSGKTLDVITPNGVLLKIPVRVDGKIPINVNMNGEYKIYTFPITHRNSVTTLLVEVP